MPLYSAFIDLTKAFEIVNREALWTVFVRIRCPPKFVTMIRLFHDSMTGQVLSSGHVMDSFEISNGVKQGCILALVLFNVFFTFMLSHTVLDLEQGVYIHYCLDGSLFDLRRLTAKTKSPQDLPQEVLSADDCALVDNAESDQQLMLDRFSDASKLFGLTINLGKTVGLHQSTPNTTTSAPTIVMNDTQLAIVEHFKYLGSTISRDGSLDKEIDARISKIRQALGRLCNRMLSVHPSIYL